ncbi:restriction endonuclease subunit S, partial [Acinetobacter baumannii]
PEHWKLLQTRHIFNFGKGLTITKEDLSDEGIPCINYGEIHSKYGFEFNPLDNPLKCVSHDFIESNKNCLLNEGDFIFADTSEDLEGSGNFSYLNQKSTVFAGYHTIIARPKSGLNHRYLAYMFDSNAYRGQVRTEMKGVKVYSVSQGVLKSRLAWLPPIEEQDQIVKLLDEKTSKIDTLIAKQRELIAKLKNYRTSIISHAVTGKIDVRDLVA